MTKSKILELIVFFFGAAGRCRQPAASPEQELLLLLLQIASAVGQLQAICQCLCVSVDICDSFYLAFFDHLVMPGAGGGQGQEVSSGRRWKYQALGAAGGLVGRNKAAQC